MIENLGKHTVTLTLLGYVILLSYTWPHGFVPLVAVQSLPILILGFLSIMLLALIFLGILFIPFWYLNNESHLREAIYGNRFDDLKEEFRNKPIKIPINDLIKDISKNKKISILPFFILETIFILGVCFYFWYALSLSLPEPSYLIFIPLLWPAFRSLVGLLKSKTRNETIFYVLGVLFFFIIIPTLPDNGKKAFLPNILAQKALSITSIGGEIPVRIYPSGKDTELNGNLIFYDGNKAWLRQCDRNDTETIQMVHVESLFYLNNDKTSCNKIQMKYEQPITP